MLMFIVIPYNYIQQIETWGQLAYPDPSELEKLNFQELYAAEYFVATTV